NLTPGADIDVVTSINGASTTTAKVKVVAASPGVYTYGSGGLGRITAVNQDGSAISDLRPAAKGSVVTLYASGLGAVSPAIAAGVPPPATPLSNTASPVTATLGGISIPVQFAGAAPGFPGLYQVDVQIPATTPTGTQELRISTQGVSSQAGTTIAVQ